MAGEYVTPERFKTMGFGVDLADIEDFELRAALRRASDRVNTITAAPDGHDFRGGVVTDETKRWRSGAATQRTIFTYHYPIISVQRLAIDLTNQQYIEFTANELYVTERTIEVVSLTMTANGLFGAYIVPAIGLMHPVTKADYTYGRSYAKTKEVLEATDGKMWRAQHQWWDSTVAPVVRVNGGVKLATEYTVDYDEGTITVTTPSDGLPADVIVDADFSTTMPDGIATATGILAAEALSDTEMRKRGMAGLRTVRVGEIALEKDTQMRGGQTLVTPAQAEAESYLAPHHFLYAASAF